MYTAPLAPIAIPAPAILIRKAGTNPATETRSASAWIAGRLNLAGKAMLAPLAAQDVVVEDGIFDVILADGSLPRPGKTNASARVLDMFPGSPYHPAKTDAEGNVVADESGKPVREKHQVVRVLLVIEQPAARSTAE